MPFHFVQVLLGIFHRLFSVLVPFVFHSLYSKAIALRSYHFVVAMWKAKRGFYRWRRR
jgi:hypothetical protein